MAGDWIRMRTDLYRDPKVIQMADILMDSSGPLADYVNQNNQCDMSVTRNVMRNVMRNVTVGALVSIWGVARHQGHARDADLVLQNTPVDVLDDIADLPGIGAAMEVVGWIVVDDTNLVFPRFYEEHNTDPIEAQRSKNRERQKRFRKKNSNPKRNVTVTLPSRLREEKSREELKSARNIPPTKEEIQELCKQRGYSMDPEAFYNHFETTGWVLKGGQKMKNWHAACANWEKREADFGKNGKSKQAAEAPFWMPGMEG